MTRRLLLSLLLILQVNLTRADAVELASGPMVGVTAMRSARIWFQTAKAGAARVEYWPESAPKTKLRSPSSTLQSGRQNAVTVTLNDLKPGTRYAYRVLFNGKTASPVLSFATQVLWQWRTDPPDFRVVAGSCAYTNEPEFDRPGTPYGDGDGIFAQMAAARPDLTVWLGANKVNGVMFLSGDRHHTEMLQWPRSGSYTLHELTCSPLTAGPRIKRSLVIRSVATDGRELWQHSLSASAMRTPRP